MAVPTAHVLAITSLLKRERYFRDTAQWDRCRATFHPDASKTYIHVAWYAGDVEEFLHQSARMHKGKVNIIHSSFDPVDVRVSGRRATSEAFCLVTSSLTLDGIDYELASHMRLFTRLGLVEGIDEWRLLSIESSYVRDRLMTTFPGTQPKITMTNDVRHYPLGYRNLALVLSYRGLEPRSDLPHEDAPETVKQIADRNCLFLDGAVAEEAPSID